MTNQSNSSSNLTDAYEYAPSVFGTSDLVGTGIYIAATCLPNLLQLYLFIFKIKERSYSNMCFLSLITCDLLVGALCLSTSILYFNPYEVRVGYYFGILMTIAAYAQPNTGILTLILLAWHRLKQLAWPTRSSEQMTKLRAGLLIGIWVVHYSIWIFIICLMVRLGYYDPDIPDIAPPAFLATTFDVVFNIFPVFLNGVLMGATIVLLIRKKRMTPRAKNSNVNHLNTVSTQLHTRTKSEVDDIRRKKRVFKLERNQKAVLCLLTIIGTLIVSQTMACVTWPLMEYNILDNLLVTIISARLSFANSLLNPFILFVFHDKVRSETKRLFLSVFFVHFFVR